MAFLKMEKHRETELESCFTNCIVQWIRGLDRSAVRELPLLLGLPAASTSRFAGCFTGLHWAEREGKALSPLNKRNFSSFQESLLKSMTAVFFKMSKPAAGMVLSVFVEKMCSGVKRLGSTNAFDESTGPVLANLLDAPGICDLISAVSECPLSSFLGRSS